MHKLSVEYSKVNNAIHAHLAGPLVSLGALQLKSELHNQVASSQSLIVDIRKVTEVDTTGLNALLLTQLKCAFKNAHMTIRCKQEHPMQKLLQLTSIGDQFQFQFD